MSGEFGVPDKDSMQPNPWTEDPRVSVIVPAYDTAPLLGFA